MSIIHGWAPAWRDVTTACFAVITNKQNSSTWKVQGRMVQSLNIILLRGFENSAFISDHSFYFWSEPHGSPKMYIITGFWNVLFDFVPRVFVSICVCIKFDLPTGKQTITATSYYISWPVKRTLIALLLITYSNQPWPVVIITVTQWLLHCVSRLETVIQHCGTNRRFCHKLLSLMVSTRWYPAVITNPAMMYLSCNLWPAVTLFHKFLNIQHKK